MGLKNLVEDLTREYAATEKLTKKKAKTVERWANSRGFIEPTAERFYKEWSADHSLVLESWIRAEITSQLQTI